MYTAAPAKMPAASVATISGTTSQYMPDSDPSDPHFRFDRHDQARSFWRPTKWIQTSRRHMFFGGTVHGLAFAGLRSLYWCASRQVAQTSGREPTFLLAGRCGEGAGVSGGYKCRP